MTKQQILARFAFTSPALSWSLMSPSSIWTLPDIAINIESVNICPNFARETFPRTNRMKTSRGDKALLR